MEYKRTQVDVQTWQFLQINQIAYLKPDGQYVLIDEGQSPDPAWVEIEEIPISSYTKELSELNSDYQKKVDGHNRAFAVAALSDGPSEEEKKLAIRADYEEDRDQYVINKAALKTRYGL